MNTKQLRCALYARVSTAKDQTPEMQLAELRQVAAQRGWSVVDEFVDAGFSGAKDRRPALDRMMTAVRAGKVDLVAVWRFDRFARSVRHLVLALDEFRALSIDFVSMRDAIDTSTASGRFSFHIFAAVAELERELIRDRTRAGLAVAKARGIRVGRPPVHVDIAQAAKLKGAGRSLREIASELGVGLATLHRALHTAAIAGVPQPSPKPPLQVSGSAEAA